VEITTRGGKIAKVETLLITEEMAAGLVPNAEVTGILTETGKRLGDIAASAAKAQAEAEAAAKAKAEAEAVAAKAQAEEEAAAAKAQAEAEAAAKAQAEAEAKEETFRIIGTNGLLNLALASYEGGMGFAEVSAIVDFAKSESPTLVLDVGLNEVEVPDLPIVFEEGDVLAAVIDEIGYYAMTPGTADLLFGVEALKMLDENTAMSVLSANIRQNGELVFAPSTLVQAGDVNVGIFGLTTPLAAGMGVEVSPTQEDLMAAAEAAVMDLKAQGAEYIIALTNMGFEQGGFSAAELDWAAGYVSGYIDLIIDGMGSLPFEKMQGETTIYVQLGGAEYVREVIITARGGKIVDVEILLITEEAAAGLVPNVSVTRILAGAGAQN
jgi:5'-nucleotidase / UDP-sugar diphosphatase